MQQFCNRQESARSKRIESIVVVFYERVESSLIPSAAPRNLSKRTITVYHTQKIANAKNLLTKIP